MHYFADHKWWQWHKDREEFRAGTAQKCTIHSTGMQVDDPEVHMLLNDGSDGTLSHDARAIKTGLNSGHQIINIAALSGASRILLIGYDAHAKPEGRHHFFGEHPDKTFPPYAQMVANMRIAAPILHGLGVAVVNCTPGSAIDAFPVGDLKGELQK